MIALMVFPFPYIFMPKTCLKFFSRKDREKEISLISRMKRNTLQILDQHVSHFFFLCAKLKRFLSRGKGISTLKVNGARSLGYETKRRGIFCEKNDRFIFIGVSYSEGWTAYSQAVSARVMRLL